ncbi:hypothetical protein [Thiorhodovibrio frisius]|uniref:YrhK domain-containing protein n=1 Tax=Thiorhodovibrio frisius TaxID=631362 RepID=H8Z387_9GAMM|nr:hypothetical protein [Thiorhodovibrio frisius]EIC21795.1 hypothetical protein Thi970DRAFT_02028 [Thiorhodovibrio frisius]WPL21765.1 hypothetical protein Thiofri_01898 [Thiorhodovibrio frisius]
MREPRRFDTAEARSFQHVFRHAEAGIELHWNARNHRKGRSHPLKTADGAYAARVRYRLFALQWRSLSWWVAAVFTFGSLVWLVNGLGSVLPLSDAPVIKAEVPIWTAVLGGGIFLIGAYLSWLEVLNAPRYVLLFRDDEAGHSRALHADNHHLRWFGLRPANWGYWLNLVQLLGATIFFVPCVVGALLAKHPAINAFAWFWLPQMIGASWFMIAAWMAMREVQPTALSPAWNSLGWWSGLFNLLGAIGFFLCAWFGFKSDFENPMLSNGSTFLGSCCFLIASYLMLIEIINPEGPEGRHQPRSAPGEPSGG